MLSSDEIAAALKKPAGSPGKLTIVPKPDIPTLSARGGTSIDLRLGRWFKSFKQTRTNSVELVASRKAEQPSEISRTKQYFVPFGSSYVLHPGRFVLGATLEWICLPGDLSGYITGKSSLGRHGLVIETAAGIHPYFAGCLTLELANVGEVPLEIFPGMQVCQVFLHKTSPTSAADLGKFSGRRKPVLSPPKFDSVFDKLRDN